MNDEVNAFGPGDADFQESALLIMTNSHHQITDIQDSHRVSICVEQVIVRDSVLSGTENDDGIHLVNIS